LEQSEVSPTPPDSTVGRHIKTIQDRYRDDMPDESPMTTLDHRDGDDDSLGYVDISEQRPKQIATRKSSV